MDLAILFLLGEFILDGELGLVDEGLLFKVEVVLGLMVVGWYGGLGRCSVRKRTLERIA